MEDVIYAKFLYPANGYKGDQEQVKKSKLIVGEMYLVTDIDMGQSHTNIRINDYNISFNSVHFEFYDDDGNEIDLTKTRYNPYEKW